MYIGKPVKRIEDLNLIRGRGQYVDDIVLPNMKYVAFVRSERPHALVKVRSDVPFYGGEVINPGLDFPIVSKETTYVGQPLGAVVGRDQYEVHDMLEEVEVEYQDLPYEVDPRKAMKDEVKVYSKLDTNVGLRKEFVAGDPEKALKESPVVIEGELRNQRMIATPMETRGIVAWFDGRRVNVWSSTQSAHFLRRNLTSFLKTDVHAVQPDVGGAFGSKIITHPEEYAVSFLSLKLGIPLKWVPTRTEEMMSSGHGRDKSLSYKVGTTRDGVITALVGTVIGNLGAPYQDAYDDESGNVLSTSRMILGPYNIRNARVEALGVYTNLVPTTSYRGAGRPEGTFFIESIMNELSLELGIDQLEIRKRNVVKSTPYQNAFGITYDSGDYTEILRKSEPYYEDFKRRAIEEGLCVGLGMYVEITGFGPWETARVYVKSDGKVVVISGAGPHGQGDGTAFAQIAADVLELPIEEVEVQWGDTAIIEDGIGTWGSRTVTVGGSAVMQASQMLKDKLKQAGSKVLNVDVEEVEYEGGKVKDRGSGKALDFREVVSGAYKLGIPLDVTAVYPVTRPTSPYGIHMALVSLDRETGTAKVRDYLAIDDVGNVINPMLAEGQIHGGVLQGISQALYEGVVLEEGRVVNLNVVDYLIPTAVESPRMKWEHFTFGVSSHPTGSKGIGEAGAVVATPVIMNAVSQCLGRQVKEMPWRPA
ncbi:xanthine dehydrogenase family protein molybdopterin-binding subunit [Sulfuracidifex tepidarius]|uniref:Glyceraldehyde dehydrogenase large chain n=1 Tax=Sulfuracidifex tepidarius TaxID=1294262 RepID=A0A510E5T0_9CREN|nr:xanthine dehydrogenase family protein molybdopterin-binding subunit [Sulfuracidifex tepidarius]BBG27893.1 Glyceraldehyde dehydrogenase large chain [Sulfuracidifex tepidarius]